MLEYGIWSGSKERSDVLGKGSDVTGCIDVAFDKHEGPNMVICDVGPDHNTTSALLLLGFNIAGVERILGTPTAPLKPIRAPKLNSRLIRKNYMPPFFKCF